MSKALGLEGLMEWLCMTRRRGDGEEGGAVATGSRWPGGKRYQVMQRTPQDQKKRSSYAALACIFVDDLEWVAQASWQTFLINPRATYGSYQ